MTFTCSGNLLSLLAKIKSRSLSLNLLLLLLPFVSFRSCGNYIENTVIPDDKVSVNAFSVISDKLQEQLKTIITAPILDDEIEPFKMVKKLYTACMNKSELISHAREQCDSNEF
jgi:hypothetical protein